MLSCFIWGPASTIGLPAQNTTAIRQHLQNLPEVSNLQRNDCFGRLLRGFLSSQLHRGSHDNSINARAPIYNTVFASEYRSCSPNCRQQIFVSVSFFFLICFSFFG